MSNKKSSKQSSLSEKSEMFEDIISTLPMHPTKVPDKQTKITKIVVHMTDGVVTPKGLAKYDIGPNHISKTGCPSITYHYLIDQSGKAFKCLDHANVTWHAGPHNPKSLAVVLNYKGDDKWEKAASTGGGTPMPTNKDNTPSKKALDKLIEILVFLCLEEGVSPKNISGHRELSGTGWTLYMGSKRLRKTCPGMSVNLDDMRNRVVVSLQQKLLETGLYGGKVDGLWGKISQKALEIYSGK